MASRDPLVEAAAASIGRSRRSAAGFRLVVAVSGGADSVCLLDVLVRLSREVPISLSVVHVDHGFRADSSRDAELVRDLAARLDVPSEIVAVDGPGYARQHKLGLEEAGRALRYQVLAMMVSRLGAKAVATGHTADDSVESMLMHLLRGAGTDGLRGMADRVTLDVARLGPPALQGVPPTVTVVRPLLAVRRLATTAYCQDRGVDCLTDPMNQDPSFLRSRVRHHLLPTLRTYNPAVDSTLVRTAEVLRDDGAWLDRLAARQWGRVVRPAGRGLELSLAVFRRQPRAAQRRLVRRAVAELRPHGNGLGFESIERVLAFAAADRPRILQLPQRMLLTRDRDRLRLTLANGGT